jgi:DNA adenine methylase
VSTAVPSPLKFFGGKTFLASKIIAEFPPHLTYLEPFAGGLSVLLAKNPEGVSEVVNDLDGELTNFWECLADGIGWGLMQRRLEATPFSEWTWEQAHSTHEFDAPVDRAIKFFVRCRQSLAGRGDSFAAISTSRTRRGLNEQVSAWLTAVEGLPEVHARLKRVLILNRDALKVIRDFDKPGVLQFMDPPYLSETRASKDVYDFEFTDDQHRELLGVVKGLKHAKVALSGYSSPLYEEELAGWRSVEWEQKVHSGQGKSKRVAREKLWMNY